jgi:hypothetical protein
MFETICTLPLTADLFAQALHPREPVLSIGLSSGHVQTLRLPSADDADGEDEDDDGKRGSIGSSSSDSRSGRGQVATRWRTRRHKVSCRALAFSQDGATLYSGGGDAIVKQADAETGKVGSKIVVVNPYAFPPPQKNPRRRARRKIGKKS